MGKDKLTKQEKAFVNDVVTTGNATEAVLKNYDVKNANVAGVTGHRLLSKVKIQKAIVSIADSIPDDLLKRKMIALLNKEEVITKNNMTTGEIDIIPTGEMDVQAVTKGLDMAFKIKGTYAPEKTINANITINTLDPKSIEIAKKYEDEIKQEL